MTGGRCDYSEYAEADACETQPTRSFDVIERRGTDEVLVAEKDFCNDHAVLVAALAAAGGSVYELEMHLTEEEME